MVLLIEILQQIPNPLEITDASRSFGEAAFMFTTLAVVVILAEAYVIRYLYADKSKQNEQYLTMIKEKDQAIKERDEANLETLKDVVNVLSNLHEETRAVAPELTGAINNSEGRIIERINAIKDRQHG